MKNLRLNKDVSFILAKNQTNRNKTGNKAKLDKKNLDFMPFIQNNSNGYIEWEYCNKYVSVIKLLKIQCLNVLQEQKIISDTVLILKARKNRFKRELLN